MINVGVIGIGNMGFHHARNYFEMPDANLVALADMDEARGLAAAKRFECRFYRHYKEMILEEEID